MSIGSKKGKKGSLGTSFIIEKIPGKKRISCINCSNYNSDNSCSAKPIFISEIGYDFWKNCDSFSLATAYDNDENQYLVARSRPLKLKNKKKKKKRSKIEAKNSNYKSSSNTRITQNIYPTEKKLSDLVYSNRGKTREEKLSDEKVRKLALERERKKFKEDTQKYEKLMVRIGKKEKIESLYTKHFSKAIETLDFIDELDSLIEGKNVSESELVFIREYIYKKYNKK